MATAADALFAFLAHQTHCPRFFRHATLPFPLQHPYSSPSRRRTAVIPPPRQRSSRDTRTPRHHENRLQLLGLQRRYPYVEGLGRADRPRRLQTHGRGRHAGRPGLPQLAGLPASRNGPQMGQPRRRTPPLPRRKPLGAETPTPPADATASTKTSSSASDSSATSPTKTDCSSSSDSSPAG